MRFRKIITVAVLISLLFSFSFAINEDKIYEETLENGLHVIAYEMQTAPMIYSRLTYNVGAKYEPYGQTGISHIVEHMMFKGTERFNKGKISKLISANGGVFNAFTSSDITVYYEFLPKNKIDLAFDIESERMHKCKFDPAEFESEINVIKEERKMRTENSAQGMRREEMNSVIYKSHPYKNPVIGWMHDIDNITRDQAYAYYKKYYTPNNATLILCGDFKTAEIIGKVKKYFGKIPRGPELEKMAFPRVAPEGKKTLEFKHSEIMAEAVNMHFNVPPGDHQDAPALYVASKILASRSATSRLHKRLVRKDQMCTLAAGGMGLNKDSRTLSIMARLLPDASLEKVEEIIWQEIDSMKYTPVADYDLQKIKNKLEFEEITGDQYISKVGNKIGLYENYFGWEFINDWPQKIQQVSKQDIMNVMQKYFVEKNLFVCYSFPDTTAPTEILTETETAIEEPREEEVETEVAAKKGFFAKIAAMFRHNVPVEELYAPDLNDVTVPAPIEPMVKTFELDNGVPVYLVENHDFPTTYVMGFIKTGNIEEDADMPGIKHFVGSMLNRGTKSRDYDEMLEERSFTPYQASVDQGWSAISFSGYSLKKDTDKMLHSVFDMLSNSTFPEKQIEKLRPRLKTSAENYNNKKEMIAFYKMFKRIFKNHPYALPHAGDPETFTNATREQMLAIYDKYYSPERMKIVAVGDFDKAWIRDKLNHEFGQWQKESQDPMTEFSEIEPLRGKTVFAVNIPKAKQCRVDIGFNPVKGGIKSSNKDLAALDILERILCGSTLTSRMGVELRDNRGLCYGIRSNLWVRKHGGYWNIRTNTDADNVNEMIHGMFEQIELVQKEGITPEELEKAKFRALSMLTFQLRTADDIGYRVFDMLKNEQPLNYFDTEKDRIMAVTAEDVKRVANKYLDTENYVISVSGNIEEKDLAEFK